MSAHVYRLVAPIADADTNGIPVEHFDAIFSTGSWVLVYGTDHDGWNEWGGGFNDAETAERSAVTAGLVGRG